VVLGPRCNLNMCIRSCKWLCFVGSHKSSFITSHGICMKFNICWCTLKPLGSSDSTSQLHLHQINYDFLIHKICYSWVDYVRSLDSNYDLKVFSWLCIISIILDICIFFLLWWNTLMCGLKVHGFINLLPFVNNKTFDSHNMFPCILSFYI